MRKECATREAERLVEDMLADRLDAAGWDRLLRLAETDPVCREFVDLHHGLLAAGLETELPDAEDFSRMRAGVLREIRTNRARERLAGEPASSAASVAFAPFGRLGWALGGAALVLLVAGAGFLAGRGGLDGLDGLGRDARDAVSGDAIVRSDVSERELLAALDREARDNEGLLDVENADFLFSNVAIEEAGEGQVELRFDVTRHVRVRAAHDAPLVAEAMAQTLVNRAPLGEKLQAIDFAGRVASPKIKQGLIFSMLNDPELAVRLRAQSILLAHAPDPELESAFLAVLAGEDSTQMRLLAMDWLAAAGLGDEQVGDVLRAIGTAGDAGDPALLVRAADKGWLP